MDGEGDSDIRLAMLDEKRGDLRSKDDEVVVDDALSTEKRRRECS